MSRRKTHEEFINMAGLENRNIKVLDRYILSTIPIRFECKNGHIWNATPNSIMAGNGCPYCAGAKVLIGFNDLWTTRPDVANCLLDPCDGHKYTFGSNKFVKFKCTNCGYIKEKSILQVSQHGMQCQMCSDGISYPNKFARALLDQLPIDCHICEYRPDWAKPYFYDNYFIHNENEYILEMDGAFHYKTSQMHGASLERVLEIDKIKTDMANSRGINIIRIDCLYSNCDYIKHNILLSKLSDVFDLSNIDWSLCDKIAQKHLIKETCSLYMSVTKNLSEIANMLHICRDTVYHYVKIGAKFGWCDYDPDIARKIAHDKQSKKIMLVDNNENIICVFDSLRLCEREMKEKYGVVVYRNSISKSCKTHKPYKGFNFRFVN